MKSLELVQAGLFFACELAVYAAVAAWALRSSLTAPLPVALRAVLAVLAIAAMATAWGLLAAPKASMPLHCGARAAFETTWFALGVLALLASGAPWWAAALSAALVLLVGAHAALG